MSYLVAALSLLPSIGLAYAATPAKTSGPYRGPANNGIFAEEGLMQAWPAEGPALLWKARLGEGYASVVVADDLVYGLGGASGSIFGFTLDGQQKLKYSYGSCSWARFNGSRSTPLLRDGVVAVTAPSADIYGIDLATGQQRWKVNAWQGFGSGKGRLGWGFSCSPPMYEDKIILNPISRDDETPPIVAIDFATGKTLWQADAGKGKRYSGNSMSGVVFNHNGRALNVNPTWRYMLCLDPATGKQIWEIPDPDIEKGGTKCMTPVYSEGYLVFDRAGAAVCVKLSQDGSEYTPLWSRPHAGFSMAVVLGRRVYLAGNVTDHIWKGADALAIPPVSKLSRPSLPKNAPPLPSFPQGLLCVDAQTGNVIDFVRMSDGLGHVISAGGMVYAQDFTRSPEKIRNEWQEGVSKLGLNIYLLKPVESGMEMRGHFRLPMTLDDAKHVRELEYQANINPVIGAGRLFIRYGPLWVYDVGAPREPLGRPFEPPAPSTGFWDLRLREFLDGGHDLWVTLQVADGSIVSAVAAAPTWNRATHLVDAKGAKIDGAALSGSLSVTLNPDASVPADKKAITRAVALEVRCKGGRLGGTYTGGLAKETSVEGRAIAP